MRSDDSLPKPDASEPEGRTRTGRIDLSEERRAALVARLKALYLDEFDEDLSDFRAERLIEFFAKGIGAPVYNQAIQDARAYLADRLEDLDAEFYEPEEEG